MLKAVCVNGSPRKKWNTAQLLQHAMEGASEAGAEVEMVNLYDCNRDLYDGGKGNYIPWDTLAEFFKNNL